MKTFTRGALAVAVAALLAGPAQAQIEIEIEGNQIQIKLEQLIGGQAGDPLPLLKSMEVQKDLKLSKEQIAKFEEMEKKQTDALKDLQGAERFQKMRELTQANTKAIGEILKDDQNKRFKQLQVQQRGVDAFRTPNIVNDLNLTDEQKEKVKEHSDKVRAKSKEITEATKEAAERNKRISELQRGVVEEVVKLLTPEQKTKWRDVAGEPFKGTLPPAPTGRRVVIPQPDGAGIEILPIRLKIRPPQ